MTASPEFMLPLANYFLALAPAFLVWVALLALVPRDAVIARIILHILFFVLARDAMTSSGFWQINAGSLRFTASEPILLFLAGMSGLLCLGTFWLEPAARDGMRFSGAGIVPAVAIGAGGAILISVIAAFLKIFFSLPSLPAPGPGAFPVLFIFSMAGNAYEELLFRGLLQNTLSKILSPSRSAMVSGLLFCLCHSYLATTVTHIGAPILAFTLLEGLVAAFVYLRAGLLGAMLSHGLAIFVIAAGLY